jgi:putative FmdB family regulatory protein
MMAMNGLPKSTGFGNMEYDFVCKDCGKGFSVNGRFESLIGLRPECPECKSSNCVKRISSIKTIYKGDGFYTTDNRKKSECEE